jgi:hypothetical protein
MTPIRTSPRRPRLAALALAALLPLAACDFSDDDDGPIVGDSDIVYVDFSFDGDEYRVSEDGLIASFESDEIDDADEREAVQDALAGANDGALVLLYVDGELVFGAGGAGTWTALPITQAFENPDEPFVDYTVTYSYSYDDADLYFDAFTSAEDPPLDWSTAFPSRIFFRLVTAPAYAFARAGAHVDTRDYEAVRRALALPE